MSRFFVFLLLTVLLFAFAGPATAAGGWSEQYDIRMGEYDRFLDISDDGLAVVTLDMIGENGYQETGYGFDIMYYHNDGGSWTSQVIARNGVKTDFPYFETHPVISGDGSVIVYMGEGEDGKYLYEARKQTDGTFTAPRIIESVPTGWFGAGIDINYSGDLVVYICGDGDGWFGGTATLYYIEWNGSSWSTPNKVYDNKSGEYQGAADSPSLNKDGTNIAWIQNSYQGDVFYCQRSANGFDTPVILTTTDKDEKMLKLSGDGNTIAFWRPYAENSTYTGQDLFVIKKNGGFWGTEHKITPVPEEVTLSYDSRPALNYGGTRLIYNNYYKNDDVIDHGRLATSEFTNGNWSVPVEITDTSWLFDTEPNLSDNGQILIYSVPSGIALRTNAIPPPAGEIHEDEDNYQEWPSAPINSVDKDKKWAITFNRLPNPGTINNQSIYVKDSNGTKLKNLVQVADDNAKKAEVFAPAGGYAPGATYVLYISKLVTSSEGKSVAQPVKITFNIQPM